MVSGSPRDVGDRRVSGSFRGFHRRSMRFQGVFSSVPEAVQRVSGGPRDVSMCDIRLQILLEAFHVCFRDVPCLRVSGNFRGAPRFYGFRGFRGVSKAFLRFSRIFSDLPTGFRRGFQRQSKGLQ